MWIDILVIDIVDGKEIVDVKVVAQVHIVPGIAVGAGMKRNGAAGADPMRGTYTHSSVIPTSKEV